MCVCVCQCQQSLLRSAILHAQILLVQAQEALKVSAGKRWLLVASHTWTASVSCLHAHEDIHQCMYAHKRRYTQTHTLADIPPPPHTHTLTHTHTLSHTHTHTHTHKHIQAKLHLSSEDPTASLLDAWPVAVGTALHNKPSAYPVHRPSAAAAAAAAAVYVAVAVSAAVYVAAAVAAAV